MPGVQSNSIAIGIDTAFGIDKNISGIVIGLLLAIIIFGGVKRIATAASFMALGYILLALVIIAMNITAVPAIFSLIF